MARGVRVTQTDQLRDMRHLMAEVNRLDLNSERADRLFLRGLRDRLPTQSAHLRRGILLFLARAMDAGSTITTLNSLVSYLDAAAGDGCGERGHTVQQVNTILYMAEQMLDNGLERGYEEGIVSE
jgi:hypothetical protein